MVTGTGTARTAKLTLHEISKFVTIANSLQFNRPSIMPLATYVFMDLQSSGLPGDDHGDVQITELCLLAVKRAHLISTDNLAPRVQYKLRMCFNPQKKVDQTSAATSRLNLSLLKNEANFNNDVYNTINSFIRCLEKPVCLIGHNAFEFHFPLLQYHLNKMHVTLSDDIMCTDSAYAFSDLEPVLENSINNSLLSKKTGKNNNKTKMFSELWREEFCTYPIESEQVPDERRRVGVDDERLKIEGAEYNCFMIMKIAKAQGKAFTKWVEQHHCPFSEVPEMVM